MKKIHLLLLLYLVSLGAYAKTEMAAIRVDRLFSEHFVRCKNIVTQKPIFHPESKKYTAISVLEPTLEGPLSSEWQKLKKQKGYSKEKLEELYVQFSGLSIRDEKIIVVDEIGRPEFSDYDRKIRIPLANHQVANLTFYRPLPKVDPYNPPKYSPYFFKFWFDGDTAVQDCRLEYEPWGG